MKTILLFLASIILECYGHGRLWLPPSRSSMWRQGFNNPENYNDHELFCGGFNNQHNEHNGKCGMCGDPYQGPRENEAGGLYGNGVIGDTFTEGETIEISLDITANHMGWHEFSMCANNNINSAITQECLDENLLVTPDGISRVYQPEGLGFFSWNFVLPQGVTCNQCVIQWKWNTGNRWGVDPDGTECVGCGPQEQFYGCSDITILPTDGTLPPTSTDSTTTTEGSSTTSTTSSTTTTQQGSTTTEDSVTTTPQATTTQGSIDAFCDNRVDGVYAHPTECTMYIQCFNTDEYIETCPACTYFNPTILGCDFPLDDALCYDDPCSVLP